MFEKQCCLNLYALLLLSLLLSHLAEMLQYCPRLDMQDKLKNEEDKFLDNFHFTNLITYMYKFSVN